MRLKIFIILIFILYQTNTFASTDDKNDFNHKYLSSYFSALLSFGNQNNDKALKFFETSKYIKESHGEFLKGYVFSLVFDGQIKKAINQIKLSRNTKNSNFFEGKLLLVLDLMNDKKYIQQKLLFRPNFVYKYR